MGADPDPQYRHQRLLGALVGIQHRQLYATSGRFHLMMDQLAAWLPGWVDSMAVLAEQADAQEAEQLDLIKRAGGTIIMSPEVAAHLDPNDELGPPRLTPELLRQMRERFAASHQIDAHRQPEPVHDYDLCHRAAAGDPGVSHPEVPGVCWCRCHAHPMQAHIYKLDADGAPCCDLPMNHHMHDVHGQTVVVDREGRHHYERGPRDLCNITTCRQAQGSPVHVVEPDPTPYPHP